MRLVFFFLVFFTVQTSCGKANGNLPQGANRLSQDAGKKPNAPAEKTVVLLQPTDAFYIDQLHYKMHFAKTKIPENHNLIYLNFDGGLINFDHMSELGLKCKPQFALPRSNLSMNDIQDTVDYVIGEFDYGLIEITTTPPETGTTFSTIYIGGSSDDLGCGESLGPTSAIGVKDPYNTFSGDVGIAFEDNPNAVKSNVKRLVTHMIAAESSETLESRQIDVDLIAILQTMERALTELSPQDVIDISNLKPQIDALVPSRVGQLQNLDKIFTILAIAGADNSGRGFDISKAKDVLTNAANSPAADTLSTIATLAGAPGFGAALDIARALLGGGNGGSNSTPQISELPAVNEFMELNLSGYPLPEILNEFEETANYTQDEHKGQPALTEMVIFGYLQETAKSNFEPAPSL